MEDNKALLVITAIVDKQNASELKEYLGIVMKIFGDNGGKPIGRYKTVESLTGAESPEMIAVLEFADAGVISEMVQGEPFTALADMRTKVFSKLNMMICQGM